MHTSAATPLSDSSATNVYMRPVAGSNRHKVNSAIAGNGSLLESSPGLLLIRYAALASGGMGWTQQDRTCSIHTPISDSISGFRQFPYLIDLTCVVITGLVAPDGVSPALLPQGTVTPACARMGRAISHLRSQTLQIAVIAHLLVLLERECALT